MENVKSKSSKSVKISSNNRVLSFLLEHKFKILVAPILIVAICFLFSEYFNNKVYNLSYMKLSEIRHNLFVNENEELKASFMSGKREKEYLINGYNTELIEFGVLTFKLKNKIENENDFVFTYILKVGEATYDGVLERNPHDGSYVADIKKIVTNTEKVLATIKFGSTFMKLELENISDNWKLDYNETFKIACKELKNEIELFIEGNEFLGECYIKIFTGDEFNVEGYYWYVNFVNRTGKTISILIDPNTKEVMAKKTI